MSVTSIRGKDWVFNALWAACSPITTATNQKNANSKKLNGCFLNIPITVIFKDGKPIKSLMTDPESGLLKRVNLDDMPTERLTDKERFFQGEHLKCFRNLRKVLIEFSTINDYDRVQEGQGECFFAKVTPTLSLLSFLCLPFSFDAI